MAKTPCLVRRQCRVAAASAAAEAAALRGGRADMRALCAVLRTLVGEFEHERAVRIELQVLLERERAAELHALRRRADEQATLLHALRAELTRAGAEGLEMIDARIAEIGKPERAAAAGAGARLGASLESAVRWLRDARPGHLL